MRPPTLHIMSQYSHSDTGIPHSGTSFKFFGISGRAGMSPRSSLSGGTFQAPPCRHPRPSLGAVAEAVEERDLEQGKGFEIIEHSHLRILHGGRPMCVLP